MTEKEEKVLTPSEKIIFIKIWTNPRQIFKYINDHHHDKYATALLVLSGISRAFDRASLRDMGDSQSLEMIIGICIIVGGLFGWMTYCMYAALISWTGTWLKSKGDTKSILRIISYAMLPSAIALVFLIPQIIVYGNEVFKSEGNITSAGLLPNILVYGSMLFEFILGIWTIVFCVIGISEVQKLGIGKSILNLFLPVIVVVVPMLVIFLLIARLNGQ
jgi:hypothetical protein